MVGAKIKIMWEEQLVDPPNEFIGHFTSCSWPLSILQAVQLNKSKSTLIRPDKNTTK